MVQKYKCRLQVRINQDLAVTQARWLDENDGVIEL